MFIDGKWVSKKDYRKMERALALCNEQLSKPLPLMKIERDIVRVQGCFEVPINEVPSVPAELIKREISRKLMEALEKEIQFEFEDRYTKEGGTRRYIGKLMVAISKY